MFGDGTDAAISTLIGRCLGVIENERAKAASEGNEGNVPGFDDGTSGVDGCAPTEPSQTLSSMSPFSLSECSNFSFVSSSGSAEPSPTTVSLSAASSDDGSGVFSICRRVVASEAQGFDSASAGNGWMSGLVEVAASVDTDVGIVSFDELAAGVACGSDIRRLSISGMG